jgi:hypothetical protein
VEPGFHCAQAHWIRGLTPSGRRISSSPTGSRIVATACC